MPVPVPVLHYEQYLLSIILCKMLNSQYIMHIEQAKMLITIPTKMQITKPTLENI